MPAVALCVALMLAGCVRYLESEGIKSNPPPKPLPDQEAAADGTASGDAGTGGPIAVDDSGAKVLTPMQRYEIYRGNGGAVGRPRRSQALAMVGEGGEITLNFVDADIREVMKATLGGILGANYSVAPEVQGTVTVQSARPIPRAALVSTLETVLQMHGIALVREGAMYRVQSMQAAGRGNAAIRVGMTSAAEGEGYGIQVVPLYYVEAQQMAEALRPIAREGSVLHVDRSRNVITLGGTVYERAALLEAIEIFDVNWLAGMSFGMFALEHADPQTLTNELNAILGDGKTGVAGGLVRLVPITRLNSVLAVSRQYRYIQMVQDWVERLDQPGGAGGGGTGGDRQLFIYFVQNGKAADLAAVMNDAFSGSGQTAGTGTRAPSGEVAPGLEPVKLGGEAQPNGANGEKPAERQVAAQPSGGGVSMVGGQARVVADEERNALLISGTPGEYRAALQVLRQLDRRPLEVLIEVTIADVTLSDQLEYGVRWFFQDGNHNVALSDLADGAIAPTFPGLNYTYAVTNAKAVLDLLSSVTDVEIISAPQLMVLNNQEAQLQVGDQVPVATKQSTSTDASGDPVVVTAVELKDTGVILKVTPRVNEGGLVILEIEQEVSQVSPDTVAGTLTPTISKRNINTTAAVHSGETVALGGLIQDNKTNTKVGVPILSKIPFLGALFRYTTDTVTRSELLVMVSPRVIRDRRDAREMTYELRRRMEDLGRLEAKIAPPEDEQTETELRAKPASGN